MKTGYQLQKVFLLISCVSLGGIHKGEAMAVHDASSFIRQAEILRQATEQVTKAAEQIQKLDDQLQQMKNQFEQGKKHYEAITGNKNFGEVHHRKELQQSLPREWQSLYQDTQRNLSAIQGLVDTVKSEENFNGPVEDMQKHIEGRMQQVAIVDKAVGLQAYQGLQERMEQVGNLMSEIKNTSDPKGIAELQARISIEQAYIQNEMTKLQLVGQLQRTEQQLIEQQKYQMSRRILNAQNTGMPQIRR
jgi:type IV secretion system protein VirB5